MDRNIVVAAIDFCEDYSQICFFDGIMKEPESMGVMHSNKHYLIPSLLWFDDNNRRTCYGEEARKCGETGKGTLVKGLLSAFENDEKIVVNYNEYEPEALIEKYFAHMVKDIKDNKDYPVPTTLAVTVEKFDEKIASLIYKILEKLGYTKDRARVISHSESFLYYGLSREKELFANDVVMFDYNENYFKYRRFTIQRNKKPQIINTFEKDFTEDFPYEFLQGDRGRKELDEKLFDFLNAEFKSQIVSTVYLTGTGFYEDWMEKSLEYLCSRRRVFKGYNLCVKGACYAAMEKAGQLEYKDMIFKCASRTVVDAKLLVNHQGKWSEIILSKIGKNWYEAGATLECITDEDKEVQFIIESAISGVSKRISIDISGFPNRPRRTTRIGITLGYIDSDNLVICIEDLGFGELFKSSGHIVKQIINVNDYL